MDVVSEVKAVRESAGLHDRSSRGKLVLRGNDRQTFLHNMLSNSISTLKAGEGCRAELLDERGHVVADLRVYATEDHVLLDCEPGLADKVRTILDKYIIMDDAVFEDVTSSLALFTVSGPKAADALARAGLPAPEHPYAHAEKDGVRVARTRWTGLSDFDVYAPADRGAALASALALPAISREAFETLRVEAGIPRQGGAELDDVIPKEAPALEKEAVSYTKGCYLGQEVLARIDARGHVNRVLVGLVLDGSVPPHGAHVLHDAKEIGRVTSAVSSPTLGKPIAMAYVRREHAAPGTALTLDGATATVSELPFVRE